MECAAKIAADIGQFMKEAEINEAFLLGGAVLDPLVNPQAKVNDYDVCVKHRDDFYQALRSLSQKGVPISEVMRTHNIYVVINHPTLGQIDFSCMHPEDNGIFNLEKIYARFNYDSDGISNRVIDNYAAVESLKRGEMWLACIPEKEGAYNILRRFLALSGKYNLDISRDGPNHMIIKQMNYLFKRGYPYIPQDKVRCLSRLSASLKRSPDRREYVKNLAEQQIFENAFPDIHKLFNNENFQNCYKLESAKTQKELLELMLANTDFKDRDVMVDCLLLLDKREKARQDSGVRDFVNTIAFEKTSPQRLQNKILNPILAHILKSGKQGASK